MLTFNSHVNNISVIIIFPTKPNIPEGPECEKILSLYRCTGRSFINSTRHSDSCLIQLSQDGPLYILRVEGYNKNVFLTLKIEFVLANSADPNEMPDSAAFHLDLHCLQIYPLRDILSPKR